MKHFKQLLTAVLTMLVALAVATPAFAANDGTITVQNTVTGKTYEAYKVFDATYSGTNVAYTYDGSNATFLAALQASNSPFTATANTQGSYNIAVKSGMAASDIESFLRTNKANLGTAISLFTGNGQSQTKTGLEYGYYYITTTTGTIVTIDSAIKDATVIDKNETIPVPVKTEQAPTDTADVDATTANIGDTITYKVAGTFTRYVEETLVTSLNFSDTMTSGLTPCAVTGITVKINGSTLASTDYTANVSGQTITVTIPTYDSDFLYATGSTYEITYSATVNENAAVATADSNTVTLKFNNDQNVGTDTTTVTSYKIDLSKTDGTNALAGAKFKLYDAATGGNEIAVVLKETLADGTKVYRHAKASETGVEMVVGEGTGAGKGKLVVEGLANGSYYFEETEAPDGYNKLTTREVATVNGQNADITVVNQTGVELPSTGGIGTTIFYVVGGALVITAGVLLVTKRRMAGIEA